MATTKSIHQACREGRLDVVKRLVAADPSLVDVDDQHQWRPVFHAALHRQTDVVRFLIDAGADLSAHDGYVMHYAGELPGNKEIVTWLLQCGALDAHVRPPTELSRQLLAAVFLANTARVKSLLQLHPHLATSVDGLGDQPIHHAARNGDTEIVLLLIEAGADVNAINSRGHTVLYCAGGHGHLETVKLLLGHGADPSARFTEDGKTLRQWLAHYPNDRRFVAVAAALSRHEDSR